MIAYRTKYIHLFVFSEFNYSPKFVNMSKPADQVRVAGPFFLVLKDFDFNELT